MIRTACRAALLVAFYLLISAATAYAECAWVRWVEETIKDPSPKAGWEIVGHAWLLEETFDSLSDCKAAMKKRISDFVSANHPPGVTAYAHESSVTVYGGRGRNIFEDFKCLPDTIDPRGPKVK